MHLICDDCFKKAGAPEEITLGGPLAKKDFNVCMYCKTWVEHEAQAKSHLLTGDTPHRAVCRALGRSTKDCSFFDFVEQNRDLDAAFDEEIKTRLPELGQEAVEYFFEKNTYESKRISRLFKALCDRIEQLEQSIEDDALERSLREP